jgi:hypothetical protein
MRVANAVQMEMVGEHHEYAAGEHVRASRPSTHVSIRFQIHHVISSKHSLKITHLRSILRNHTTPSPVAKTPTKQKHSECETPATFMLLDTLGYRSLNADTRAVA